MAFRGEYPKAQNKKDLGSNTPFECVGWWERGNVHRDKETRARMEDHIFAVEDQQLWHEKETTKDDQ